MNNDKNKKFIESIGLLTLLSQIGLMIIIPILMCLFLGKFIDEKLSTSPIFLLIFLILGIGGAFLSVYKTLITYTKRK